MLAEPILNTLWICPKCKQTDKVEKVESMYSKLWRCTRCGIRYWEDDPKIFEEDDVETKISLRGKLPRIS
jgi:rubredoxin